MFDRFPAASAVTSFSAVNPKLVLKVAGLTALANKVSERCAAGLNGLMQHRFDGLRKAVVALS